MTAPPPINHNKHNIIPRTFERPKATCGWQNILFIDLTLYIFAILSGGWGFTVLHPLHLSKPKYDVLYDDDAYPSYSLWNAIWRESYAR